MGVADSLFYLKKYFNYDAFQEGQKEIIDDILKGYDVLGVLRTGSGKSLCYQLPAIMLPGSTIVVSPLISLMVDQVRQVKSFHYKEVVALHSFQNRNERMKALNQLHRYKLIYISPELLQQETVLNILKTMKINLFVIDEAHCISHWGYDFRPDYLRLANIIQSIGQPTILALTATAAPEVQQDIMEKLERKKMRKHIYPMDRENISLLIHHLRKDESKLDLLTHLLTTYKYPMIIYFSSRKIAEQVATNLSELINNRKVAYYD